MKSLSLMKEGTSFFENLIISSMMQYKMIVVRFKAQRFLSF